MIAQGIVDYDIDELEFAYLSEDTPKSTDDMRLYIPILMPKVDNGDVFRRRQVIDNTIFVNDKACAHTVPSSLLVQNFVTVRRHPDLEMKRHLKGSDVQAGSRVMLHIINKSIDNMYIIRQM